MSRLYCDQRRYALCSFRYSGLIALCLPSCVKENPRLPPSRGSGESTRLEIGRESLGEIQQTLRRVLRVPPLISGLPLVWCERRNFGALDPSLEHYWLQHCSLRWERFCQVF